MKIMNVVFCDRPCLFVIRIEVRDKDIFYHRLNRFNEIFTDFF
jgi:hypothetical protein